MSAPQLNEFPEGLALIGTGFAEIKPEQAPLNQPLDARVELNVPEKTKYVHVAVTTMDISFRTGEQTTPSALASIWFEIIEPKLSGKKFKFRFRAVLQNSPNADPTGPWNGTFWVEFLCFG
jgi:hypothetical protein